MREIRTSGSMSGEVTPACGTLPYSTATENYAPPRLVQYKMSLKGGVIPTQDEPGGNLGKVD